MLATAVPLAPVLTPQGRLRLEPDALAPPLSAELQQRLSTAFAQGSGAGLLQLGAAEVGTALAGAIAWWRDFAARYVTGVCATPDEGQTDVPAPAAEVLDRLARDLPPMTGAQYLTPEVLRALWAALDGALRADLAASRHKLGAGLHARHPAWTRSAGCTSTWPRTARIRTRPLP
ncbi:MAG: hypothetical protein H7242_07425 [Microbacteriaceae bacterium]|nr:hypothetical protein [Burkholderiaceae bacterium]